MFSSPDAWVYISGIATFIVIFGGGAFKGIRTLIEAHHKGKAERTQKELDLKDKELQIAETNLRLEQLRRQPHDVSPSQPPSSNDAEQPYAAGYQQQFLPPMEQ
ncbi:MAG TPA: hypothetical protein VNG90_00700 [Candidatus Acidoferrum sp.]|nr:hypothetical protein [Candidatus Acidoferrum sp.]